MTRKELGLAADVDESTIYRIEQGKVKRPTPKTLRSLARALGVNVEQLTSDQARLDL